MAVSQSSAVLQSISPAEGESSHKPKSSVIVPHTSRILRDDIQLVRKFGALCCTTAH